MTPALCDAPAASSRDRNGYEFFLTSYMLGAPDGKNLGAPGYSHEFVARLFRPLLERWGSVTEIKHPRDRLHDAVAACRARGAVPVHFSVLPLQDVCFADDAINIVMPAWEFPDVPNHPFNGNPQNDWPATARRADMLLVSGPFTAQAFERAGTTTPVAIVPVPTPDDYFQIAPWSPGQVTRLDCWAFVFPSNWDAPDRESVPPAPQAGVFGRRCENGLRSVVRGLFGRKRYDKVSALVKDARHGYRRVVADPDFRSLPYPQVDTLELSGIVYTSILNPSDGRKNWVDLLNAFLVALADKPDATLVIKLIAKNKSTVRQVIDYYLHRDIKHRSTVVFVCDFLADEQMLQLCQGSTYYLQASKAEGNCLPLMNYLAAARPGISPDHSSMGDYFHDDCGFVVESHPEPSAFPHDRQLRIRTTWARIVWTSLRDQIANSYSVAREAPGDYAAMARRCRRGMDRWAGYSAVAARLDGVLGDVFGIKPVVQERRGGEPASGRSRAAA